MVYYVLTAFNFYDFMRRRIFIYIALATSILILVLIFGGWYLWSRIQKDFGITSTTIQRLTQNDFSSLKSENDRVTIAVLGQGGEGHESGTLTDSMLVLSLNLKTGDQTLISIPRDLWSSDLQDRINTAYYYAEEKEKGSGLAASKQALSQVIGIPIQYGVRLDFSGFSELIDIAGGVDVTIDESFTDTQYPIKGKENDLCEGDLEYKCRYEEITFTKGVEHMNGDRALKYVRSRHSSGETGTDFSRGKRQQAVISALKQKLLSSGVLTNWDTLKQIWQKGHSLVDTDLSQDDELLVAKFVGLSGKSMETITLGEDDASQKIKGLLINPPVQKYGGRWVLVPKSGDYSTIHGYIQCRLQKSENCDSFLN